MQFDFFHDFRASAVKDLPRSEVESCGAAIVNLSLRSEATVPHNDAVQSRMLSAVLFAALVAAPVWAQNDSHAGGNSSSAPDAASSNASASGGSSGGARAGYHSSAGYGSAYGWGYDGWTKNGWHDGKWYPLPTYREHAGGTTSQPHVKSGNSPTTHASQSEVEAIQEAIARRRAQRSAQPSQPATSAGSSDTPKP